MVGKNSFCTDIFILEGYLACSYSENLFRICVEQFMFLPQKVQFKVSFHRPVEHTVIT